MQIKFDDINVPTEKLEQVINENMYEIKRQYKKKKHWNHLIRGTAAAAAALAVTGIFASNPALAAKLPLVGHIFEKVQDKQQYPGNFDEVATPIKDGNISESGGITMTLSEIYCDSSSIYVTAMIETEKPFPEKVKESNMLEGSDIGYHMYLDIEQEFDFMTPPETYDDMEWPGKDFTWTPLDLKGEYVDEHTYIGAMRISFSEYPIAGFDIPDTFRWKLKVSKISNLCEPKNQNFSQTGTWEFETDILADHSTERVVQVNEGAPNGDVIDSVTMTPYEVRINYGYDESKVEAAYERFDSLQCVMVDADGRRIDDKVGIFSPSGYNLSNMTVYYLPTPTEEAHDAILEKLHDESFTDQLVDYMEGIAVHKIEIDLGDYYQTE